MFEIAKAEFAAANKAGLKAICDALKASNKSEKTEEKVVAPPTEVTTGQISGIEVMDLEDAVQALWKLGIYAESGMGCTGPIVKVNEAKLEVAYEALKKAGYCE